MMFIIAIITVLIIPVLGAVKGHKDRYSTALGGFGMGMLLSVGVGLIFVLIIGLTSALFKPELEEHSQATYDLRAINTGSDISGTFYLGAGSIEGYRTLDFIMQYDNGSNRVAEARADKSLIWEDSKNPTVTIHQLDGEAWWIAPFPIVSDVEYTFHIPEGSILESTSITNK